MKQISGNCILPFGLWGEDPPDHIITSIELIDNVYIVTGDKLGQMIVWKIGTYNKISPLWYLLGHSGSIYAIARAKMTDTNDSYIVSLTVNKEMGIWCCVDGRCVRLDRHLTVDHKVVQAYRPSINGANTVLVCCGHYAGIHVLDLMTLKTLFTLQSRAHSDWIRSVCVFEHRQRGMHVVLGLSISGAITMWTIESLDGPKEDKIFFETESKMLLLTCPISISICPSKPRLVMVLASTSVHIYDAASWGLLSEHNSHDSYFLSGSFLSPDIILLRQKNEECRLYHVPVNIDHSGNTKAQLTPLCSLDCNDCEVVCQSVVVKGNKLMVAAGIGGGCVYWWHMDMDEWKKHSPARVNATDCVVLKDKWEQMDMASLTRPFKHLYKITCCHCEPAVNCLMMGTSSGEILIMELLQCLAVALFWSGETLPLPFTVLRGHTKSVLVLRYARTLSESESHSKSLEEQSHSTRWLWSGGEDFSIRLWNLEKGTCVNVFHCHSGPVTRIVVGPPLGLTKGKHDGHIVALKKAVEAEQEVLKPINLTTWFGQRLYVSFDDDHGVAFLSLETKRVVLHLSLFSAVEMMGWRRDQITVVLACADGVVTVWDLSAGVLDRREVGQIAEDIMDTSTDHARFTGPPSMLPRVASVSDRLLKHASVAPLVLHSVRVGRARLAPVLLCDTESLIVTIHTASAAHGLVQAQLLLSLVHQWHADQCLDSTLESTIGLLRPPRPVCHGHVNIRARTLSFPLQRCHNPIGNSVSLLAGVSICHTINNLPDALLHSSWPRLASFIDVRTPVPARLANTDNRTEVRQVCCLYATSMATTNLPRLLSTGPDDLDMAQIPLIVETFLQKYQDRCLEIREAARTLLHASLDYFSGDQRHELVQFWGFYGRILTKSDILHVDVEPMKATESIKASKSLSSIFEAPHICDWRYWTHQLSHNQIPSEIEQLQAIALSFLGIVGCRYGSPDLQLSPASNAVSATMLRSQPLDEAIVGFGLEDYRLARTTCRYLMSLLTSTEAHKTSGTGASHGATMRCLAITLLGQGFPVWEPYLEISMLFSKLLETVAPAEKVLTGWSQGQLLNDDMDAVRSARSSLLVIALARPKVFATVLSIEVLRLQTQSNQGSSTVAPTNGTQSIKNQVTTVPTQTQPPLLAARHEVIDVMRVLCEKKTREIHEVLPEMMDILLACLSKLDLRQYDLQQLFPPVLLFRIASSHTASGKVCVGTRTGHVSFYDVKIGKYNTSPGHGGPVTSVTFSPDGKQMASYSMPDNSVCIWQLSSSGLFGMGSSHQVKLASRLNVPPVVVNHTVSEEDSSLLLWLEWCENKSIHLVTNAGLINKIKL